jgi:chemotaxis protein MotB
MHDLTSQSSHERDYADLYNGPPDDSSMEPDFHSDKDGWLISYIDILTLLITLFVLMLAFNRAENPDQIHQQASTAEASRADAGMETNAAPEDATTGGNDAPRAPDLDSKVSLASSAVHPVLRHLADMDLPAGVTQQIDMSYNDKSVRLEIGNEVMFSPGDATLSLSGMGILNEIAPLLFRHDYQISIEGHTDSVPIHSQRYPSNWELSSARATSVIRFLVSAGINAERLRAVGYADTHPLVISPMPNAQAKNRRVSLVIHAPY